MLIFSSIWEKIFQKKKLVTPLDKIRSALTENTKTNTLLTLGQFFYSSERRRNDAKNFSAKKHYIYVHNVTTNVSEVRIRRWFWHCFDEYIEESAPLARVGYDTNVFVDLTNEHNELEGML